MRMRWIAVLALCVGCGAGPREVVLQELINDQVDRTRVGLHHIESRQIFRQGKRVAVDFASLLILDTASNTIKTEVVSAGDEVVLGDKHWTVVRVEPGQGGARGQVVMVPAED